MARRIADACGVLLDSSVPDEEVRGRIYAAIGEEKIAQASISVSTLVRPSDDVFYGELNAKKGSLEQMDGKSG